MVAGRRPLFINPDARRWKSSPRVDLDEVYHFHKNFPGYKPSDLIPLDDLAAELGIGKLYIKYEGERLGLPSFKILGASWGTYQAILRRYRLPQGSDFETIRVKTAQEKVMLTAATDGNHGRAVARLGRLFNLPVNIYVPAGMDSQTISNIEEEGAIVIDTGKAYDAAITDAAEAAKKSGSLLIQDCAFEGYEEVPQWIVDGYTTCLWEIDNQLGQQTADMVIVPSGVGSLAQAVVSHYRREGSGSTVLAVEPDTAACLWKSLKEDQSTPIETTATIMAGLDCGTVSTTAWPALRSGTSACATVSDYEAHQATEALRAQGIHAGPCGAAGLAALRRLNAHDRQALEIGKDSVVVLLGTEAGRPYETPRDVRVESPENLTKLLVDIHSEGLSQGRAAGSLEISAAQYIMAWLEHRDIECHLLKKESGQPSVMGMVKGSGPDPRKTLVLKASLEVKLSQGGCLAAKMIALARARDLALRGNVVLIAGSEGTGREVEAYSLAAGSPADSTDLRQSTAMSEVGSEADSDCQELLQEVGLQPCGGLQRWEQYEMAEMGVLG
ncbi:pyridoxal-phosphate dependent enzyme domain-containing protein [Sarocladium implicatum]|nr:pyridoxal-phosphate dependent enzyme domain-containing protein [Sarocladium implicatum]